jgi:quercetin dioxygenase-like cupin family protein
VDSNVGRQSAAAGRPGSDCSEAPLRPPSPRPTFDGPTAIPYAQVTRHLWGDETSGEVSDWIYASSDKLHMLVFGLPPGGSSRHSDANRTVFGADVTYSVLEGTLVLANPERGEVQVANAGETVLFRRDTWHHIFAHSTRQLRVLEFFAPPPSTGTSQSYAQTRPFLEEARYTDDSLLGVWPTGRRELTLEVRRSSDFMWRCHGDALVGVIVSTEHLTVATLSLLPGQRSTIERRGGDECLYVLEGVVNIRSWTDSGTIWSELRRGDGFYCPEGVDHQYFNVGDSVAKAVFGVAPQWRT